MPTDLILETTAAGNTAVVRCSGRLTAGQTEALRDEVRALMPGYKRLVLDLTDVRQMDSMGLGTLVSLYVSCKASGRTLELINFSKQVRQVLSITNVLSLFEACGDQSNRIP